MPAPPTGHDQALARAFDGQAAAFEKSPLQSSRAPLEQLAAAVQLPADSLILDVGCGPGLLAECLLEAGYRVLGVDLSRQMVDRARARCARFGERAQFIHGSFYEQSLDHGFSGVISRYVLHHVDNPLRFIARQAGLLSPGGVLVVSDHTTDPDPARAAWHQEIERLRDTTHTRNLTAGAIVDLLAACGLMELTLAEQPFTLDFDEWFDRGTPAAPKEDVRKRLRNHTGARGFQPVSHGDDHFTIHCQRAIVRGVKPPRTA